MTNPEKRQRRGAWLTMPSGGILAICFFLPAMKACGNDVIYPHEAPWASWPYPVGVLAVVVCSYFLFLDKTPWWGVKTLISLCNFAGAYVMLRMNTDSDDLRKNAYVLFNNFITAYVVLVMAWRTSALLLQERRAGTLASGQSIPRFLLYGAISTTAWFLLWPIDAAIHDNLDDVLYGLWLSLLSSIGLVAGTWMMRPGHAEPGPASNGTVVERIS